MTIINRAPLTLAVVGTAFLAVWALGWAVGIAPPVEPPESPTLSAPPPMMDDRTVVLFDGSSWSQWRTRKGEASAWTLQGDGSIQVGPGDAVTERDFRDFQLHIEFFCPVMTDSTGQARANSGVYLHGRYEVQVLDSYGLPKAGNSCGAIYSIAPPLVNAARPPGVWQTYDIVFRAPRLDNAGEVVSPGRATVLHNGIVIHNNQILPKATAGGLDQTMPARGPILLQDHGNPIRYRNIWVREL